jgi:anti-sigma-K factor RskA
MAETGIHLDVAGYALGVLEPTERVAFELHLEVCDKCRAELAELAPAVHLLHRAASGERPPASLQARTLIAIEREAAELAQPTAPRPRRRGAWMPRLVLAGLALLAVIAAGIVGLRAGEQRQAGTVEVDTRLTSPEGAATTASVRVTETGIGRVVAIKSDNLPGLDNEREFYELWFIGPDDSVRNPDRVSAGTFHPDKEGRTAVRLAAAVVPANYPELSVSREPRDGDPRRTGPEVLRASTGR